MLFGGFTAMVFRVFRAGFPGTVTDYAPAGLPAWSPLAFRLSPNGDGLHRQDAKDAKDGADRVNGTATSTTFTARDGANQVTATSKPDVPPVSAFAFLGALGVLAVERCVVSVDGQCAVMGQVCILPRPMSTQIVLVSGRHGTADARRWTLIDDKECRPLREVSAFIRVYLRLLRMLPGGFLFCARPCPSRQGGVASCQEGVPMKEIVFQVEEDAVDGGYVARALGAGITTQAETVEELKAMVADAVRCHFDSPDDMPKVVRLHFVHEEVLTLAS